MILRQRQTTPLVSCLFLFCVAAPAVAADRETRDFSVLVDGKHAGQAHFAIDRQDDGTTIFSCDTSVKVRVFVFKYTYSFRGREIWKGGKLQRLESTSDDDGKKYSVVAAAEPTGLRVTVNGSTRVTHLNVWPTSYWQLPEAKLRTGELSLLDADTGRDLQGRLQYLDTQQLTLANQKIKTAHYRLTGKLTVDLWYDGSERLVRQEWVEDGHRTVLELARMQR